VVVCQSARSWRSSKTPGSREQHDFHVRVFSAESLQQPWQDIEKCGAVDANIETPHSTFPGRLGALSSSLKHSHNGARGGPIFDSNIPHAANPSWTPHARYQVVWQVSSYVYNGLIALFLFVLRSLTASKAPHASKHSADVAKSDRRPWVSIR
jgi:hypothetical protein